MNKTGTENKFVIMDIVLYLWVSVHQNDIVMSKSQEYVYFFIGGGWNSEYGTSIEDVKEKVRERWSDSPTLQVDWDSFHLPTEGEMKGLLSLFY
jgi:hypothetical protein